MVELGFSLAILAVIVVGTVDFARIFYFSMQMEAAARAGAQYAGQSLAVSGDSTKVPNIKAAAIAAYQSGSTDTRFPLTTSDIIVGDSVLTGNATAEVPKCAAADGSAFADPAGSPKTCSSNCSDVTKPTKVCYVKVTVRKQFSTLARFPGIPSSLTVQRSAWWRVD